MRIFNLRKLVISLMTSLLVVTGSSIPSKGASIFDLLPDGPATTGYLGFTFEETRPGLGHRHHLHTHP